MSFCPVSFDHCIVCLFAMVKRKRHTIQWSKETGQKDIQYNGQKKKDKKTYNTMVKRKRHTIQWSKEKRTKRHTIQWSKEKDNTFGIF
jgi:hypothetical protein